MEQELRRRLEEADWLSDENRETLMDMLDNFREVCAVIAGIPRIAPELVAEGREKLRTSWLNLLENCRKVEVAEGELLEKSSVFEARVLPKAMSIFVP